MKNNGMIGITRALAISGVTDYSFVDEESLWRGSEVHRVIELAQKCTLERASVPEELRGFLAAYDSFMRETGYLPIEVEINVLDSKLGLRGRVDSVGLVHGKDAIVDFKTGAIQEAVALQLCLGGHMHKRGTWFDRYAVRLQSDGKYSVKNFPIITWPADLNVALSCTRIAQWKIKRGYKYDR